MEKIQELKLRLKKLKKRLDCGTIETYRYTAVYEVHEPAGFGFKCKPPTKVIGVSLAYFPFTTGYDAVTVRYVMNEESKIVKMIRYLRGTGSIRKITEQECITQILNPCLPALCGNLDLQHKFEERLKLNDYPRGSTTLEGILSNIDEALSKRKRITRLEKRGTILRVDNKVVDESAVYLAVPPWVKLGERVGFYSTGVKTLGGEDIKTIEDPIRLNLHPGKNLTARLIKKNAPKIANAYTIIESNDTSFLVQYCWINPINFYIRYG